MDLNALVIPQAGQGILNIFLKTHGILYLKQIKNINTINKYKNSINILFFLVT